MCNLSFWTNSAIFLQNMQCGFGMKSVDRFWWWGWSGWAYNDREIDKLSSRHPWPINDRSGEPLTDKLHPNNWHPTQPDLELYQLLSRGLRANESFYTLNPITKCCFSESIFSFLLKKWVYGLDRKLVIGLEIFFNWYDQWVMFYHGWYDE